MRRFFVLPLLLPLAIAGAAGVPDSAEAARADQHDESSKPQACQLHIFPGKITQVIDLTGTSGMGGVLPALLDLKFRVKSPEEINAFLERVLPLSAQIDILKSVDYSKTKKGAGKAIVIHNEPYLALDHYNRKTTPRAADDKSACYSEIVLAGIFFQSSPMRKLIATGYYYREFSNELAPYKVVETNTGTGISNFPPKDEAEAAVAATRINEIFKRNLINILNK